MTAVLIFLIFVYDPVKSITDNYPYRRLALIYELPAFIYESGKTLFRNFTPWVLLYTVLCAVYRYFLYKRLLAYSTFRFKKELPYLWSRFVASVRDCLFRKAFWYAGKSKSTPAKRTAFTKGGCTSASWRHTFSEPPNISSRPRFQAF